MVFQLGGSPTWVLGLTQARFQASRATDLIITIAKCTPTLVLLSGADISMHVGGQQSSNGARPNGIDLQALAG